MRNKEIRYQMYADYVRHISTLRGDVFDGGLCMRNFEKIDEGWCDVQWVPIKVKTQEVGFIVLYTHPNCHPDADWYIEDAYVMPEYRNQGLMQKAVQTWVKEHPGTYCLFIVDSNEPARHMWPTVFEKMGYVPITLRQVLPHKDGLTQYGFQHKES